MYQMFLHSRDSGGFIDQWKNEKNEDFWICSIIPTAMIFLSFMLFSNVLHCFVMTSN